MNKLRSFQNCELSKAQLIARMQAHYDADELKQGRTGQSGKGCTVWCSLNTYDHSLFPTDLGLPEWLARLVDSIYEKLSPERSSEFSLAWPKVIPEGSDLTLIENQFLEWLLIDPDYGVVQFSDHPSVRKVAALHRRVIEGDKVTVEEWAEARVAAREAQLEAREAKEAVQWEARWAASLAVKEAASAAWAPWAAWAAWAAVYSAAAANKLFELLSAAPVPEHK